MKLSILLVSAVALGAVVPANNKRQVFYTSTIAAATAAVSAVAVPSPTQPGTTSSCTRFYKVLPGDTCNKIIVANNFAFNLAQFLSWNPSVGSDCGMLFLGYYVCIRAPTPAPPPPPPPPPPPSPPVPSKPSPLLPGTVAECKCFYLVKPGDTCITVSDSQGIQLSDFYTWNPRVGKDCGFLLVDYYVCAGLTLPK